MLRRALQQGVRWGWVHANPAAVASPPRVLAATITPPKPVDVARLYRLADRVDPDLAVFLVVAASTGARRSELIALRWSDVDLSNRRVRIDRGIVLGLLYINARRRDVLVPGLGEPKVSSSLRRGWDCRRSPSRSAPLRCHASVDGWR
jgi:integrase